MYILTGFQLLMIAGLPFSVVFVAWVRAMMRAVRAEHQAKLLELLVEELSNMVFKDKEAGTVVIKKELDK